MAMGTCTTTPLGEVVIGDIGSIEKSACGALTVSVRVVLWAKVPLVPVIVIVGEPLATVLSVLIRN